MNASLHKPRPTRHAPAALWRVVGAFMRMLFALFGAPEDVAARHTLTAKPYRLLLSWLRVSEAMMRRLLLIEAAAFPKPNTRPMLWPKRARPRRLMGFSADKPEDWRVSFRCFVSLSSPVRGRSGREAVDGGANAQTSEASALHRPLSHGAYDSSPARGGAKRFHSAWPLAERYEALLRVFNNPSAYARRLARRLHAAPHRRAELLRAPPDARHRIENFAALDEAARAVFNTS